jgi:tRNA G46 methylase TrmB
MSHAELGNSRSITTNQIDVHDKLEEVVAKYQSSAFLRPISQHTQDAFAQVSEWVNQYSGGIILDSCCGVGESTALIAEANPESIVIGVDKSDARIQKHKHYDTQRENYRVIRADVNDFWRLAARAEWRLEKHFLLYPNPYPKSSQLQKRWYAGPSLPTLIELGGELQVRSNWQLYTQEFGIALNAYEKTSVIEPIVVDNKITTPFERKYTLSGQQCWQLVSQL